jgi:hypothetical protein
MQYILTHRKDNHQSECSNFREKPIQTTKTDNINSIKRPHTAAFVAQSIPTHT